MDELQKTENSGRRQFVGMGCMPVFDFLKKFLLELERGHKARAYIARTVKP
jgi:hypothetical protein